MGKISLDLSSIKAAGIYTIEIDNTFRDISNPTSLRLLVGFNNKGPFNRPVFMQTEAERLKIFGEIDSKLELKGCYFNRMAQTLLTQGPILALNLLKADESIDGADQVNYAALSLDAAKKNPKVVSAGKTYGEYDYLAESIDAVIYNTKKDDPIPYIGKTPYASLFDRSKFWVPSDFNLMKVAANGLSTNDVNSFEKTNLINFANTGTDEISLLVYKPENLKSYDITAKEWWGGNENIPYGWIRPSDYISDYFIRIIAVKGNWTNYSVLSTDPIWGKYFDKKGIKKDKINKFISSEGISFIGSWTGVIIPDFVDKQGNYLYIKDKVNAQTETTGVLMAINEDAMQVISYDLNGIDLTTGETTGKGAWIYDYDFNNEAESDKGESEIGTANGYIVDMVGHGLQKGLTTNSSWVTLNKLTGGSTSETSIAKGLTLPEYYFTGDPLHTAFDTSAICLNLNGLDTDSSLDDTKVKANIKVVKTAKIDATSGAKGSGVDAIERIYAVYDASTNKRIKNAQGYQYVITSEAFYNNASVFSSTTDKTTLIKALTACVSTGTLDDSTNSSTISAIISGTPAETHKLYLRDELKDNRNYESKEVYYGTYALIDTSKHSASDPSTLETITLYSIYAPEKTSTYAELVDLQADIKKDTPNKFVQNSVSTNLYEFGVAGNNYQFDASTKLLSIQASTEANSWFGVNFLSYNYLTENVNDVVYDVYSAYYFNGQKINDSTKALDELSVCTSTAFIDASIYEESKAPVSVDNKNTFMVFDEIEANYIQVNDFVNNITHFNNTGDATAFNLIPGVTRVIKKIFVNVDADRSFRYNNEKYYLTKSWYDKTIKTKTGKRGFYLFTAIDPVLISGKYGYITRQVPISNNIISESLRFIPLKGLHISAKHRPGFDKDGRISIEGGIRKIYGMLEDEGIQAGLTNTNMIDYRYIVDSMSHGLDLELGGKVYLSRLAANRGKTTAILNLPSKRQFECSTDPIFCDTYDQAVYIKPSFKVKYIPAGGNTDLFGTIAFSLPTEDDGSKFSAAFWPNLTYTVGGKNISVPPAADVCNVLVRKHQGGNPYVIAANRNGILRNPKLTGVEYHADTADREYLEPFGVNTIIMEQNNIMIYGNQTCYQDTKSDFNKLHVRENLNTLEIACEAVLKQYNFLYNNAATRASIVTSLTPILEAMKASQAIERYNIVCDESNNTPDIIMEDFGIVDIECWMSHGMEKIVQRIKLNRYDTIND